MKRRFLYQWTGILFLTAAVALWVSFGRAFVRARYFGVPAIAPSERTGTRFLAVQLPRISTREGKYSMSARDLARLLRGLTEDGHTPIGIRDVEDFYAHGRLLPEKAVLLAFAQDDPRGLKAADAVMTRLRVRGVAFITHLAGSGTGDQRRYLSGYALGQMRRSGAWDFGWRRPEPSSEDLEMTGSRAGLDSEETPRGDWDRTLLPLVFADSESGINGSEDDPQLLRVLRLHPSRPWTENLSIVKNSWPREKKFSTKFRRGEIGKDWVVEWGIASTGERGLALMPTPRLTSAGIHLRGTEHWRDQVIEFEITRFQKQFWAYARHQNDSRFVRLGARDGRWVLEQKTSPNSPPSLIGRERVRDEDLPARVRLVLKGDSAVVHINGRMRFGGVLRIHPRIDEGEILLTVYDEAPGTARAVLASFETAPLNREWISLDGDIARTFEDGHLDELRESAVRAYALSPSWLTATPQGSVGVEQVQGDFIRALAGFYRCRLIPTVDLARVDPAALRDPSAARRFKRLLIQANEEMGTKGLNFKLGAAGAGEPELARFLAGLRSSFHERGWEVWITSDPKGRHRPLERSFGRALEASRFLKSGAVILKESGPLRSHPFRAPQISMLRERP